MAFPSSFVSSLRVKEKLNFAAQRKWRRVGHGINSAATDPSHTITNPTSTLELT